MSKNQGLATNRNHGLRDVKIQISLNTIAMVDFIEEFMGCKNRTDALVRCVRLGYNILCEIRDGSRIELHRRNGDVKELLLNEKK